MNTPRRNLGRPMSPNWAFPLATVIVLLFVAYGTSEASSLPAHERHAALRTFWVVWGIGFLVGFLLLVAARKGLLRTGSARFWIALIFPIAGFVLIFETLASPNTKLVVFGILGGAGLATVLGSWASWLIGRRQPRRRSERSRQGPSRTA